MAQAGILKPDDHVELINGELLNISPDGSKHAAVVNNLTRLLNKKISDSCIVSVRNPVALYEFNEPEPDIALLKLSDDFYAKAHPTAKDIIALIEVSDSTLDFDRSTKKSLYGSAGIPVYLIINLVEDNIEVYSLPENNGYSESTIKKTGNHLELIGHKFQIKDLLI